MTTGETGQDATSPEGLVTVTETGQGAYTQQIIGRPSRIPG